MTATTVTHAVMETIRQFQNVNADKPVAIIVTRDVGERLMSEFHERSNLSRGSRVQFETPVEHPDGSVWMEIQVMGIPIRWAATKRAERTGGYRWV